MDALCHLMALTLFATFAHGISHSPRQDHLTSAYGPISSPYQQYPPQLYRRQSNTNNTTFTYPHSHLPANRSTAAWKVYQGFLGFGIIVACPSGSLYGVSAIGLVGLVKVITENVPHCTRLPRVRLCLPKPLLVS